MLRELETRLPENLQYRLTMMKWRWITAPGRRVAIIFTLHGGEDKNLNEIQIDVKTTAPGRSASRLIDCQTYHTEVFRAAKNLAAWMMLRQVAVEATNDEWNAHNDT